MEIKDTKIKNIIKCTAKAAITIEATISLTLFMFVVVFLAGFITAVDKQLSTHIKMNRLAENMAKQMFYIKQVDEITDYSEKLKEYKDKFKENISEMKDTLPESNLIKDDYIDMVYTYDYKLPVLSKTITITQRAKVKDWTGTDMTKSMPSGTWTVRIRGSSFRTCSQTWEEVHRKVRTRWRFREEMRRGQYRGQTSHSMGMISCV